MRITPEIDKQLRPKFALKFNIGDVLTSPGGKRVLFINGYKGDGYDVIYVSGWGASDGSAEKIPVYDSHLNGFEKATL